MMTSTSAVKTLLLLSLVSGGFDFGGERSKLAKEKTVVTAYIKKGCPPCNRYHRERDKFKNVLFIDSYNAPAWVDSYPTFVWEHEGRRWYTDEYVSHKALAWQIANTSRSSSYPSHSPRWGIVGANNSDKETYVRHLLTGQHANKFSETWLRTLTLKQLRSLHDDDNERKVKWKYVRRSTYCPTGRCPK